jgi:hypothetical protein
MKTSVSKIIVIILFSLFSSFAKSQVTPPVADAIKADLDFYGLEKSAHIQDVITAFNKRFHLEAEENNQVPITEQELIHALLFVYDKLKPEQQSEVLHIINSKMLPQGSKLTLQKRDIASIGDTTHEVSVWKIDVVFGIVAPKNRNLEEIPSAEDFAKRWTVPVRLFFPKK